jgi:hypothetical protein
MESKKWLWIYTSTQRHCYPETVSGHPKCTTNGHFDEAQSAPPLDVI